MMTYLATLMFVNTYMLQQMSFSKYKHHLHPQHVYMEEAAVNTVYTFSIVSQNTNCPNSWINRFVFQMWSLRQSIFTGIHKRPDPGFVVFGQYNLLLMLVVKALEWICSSCLNIDWGPGCWVAKLKHVFITLVSTYT